MHGRGLEVGFGSAVITPPMPVVLAGFGARKGLVSEVHDDLEVHAVFLRNGGQSLCLLVLDLLMLGPEVAGPLRVKVAGALGLDHSSVLTSCTHTHSGPAATLHTKRIGWPMPEEYAELLVGRCVNAAIAAQRSAEPVALGYARGRLPADLSLNRRGLPYDPQLSLVEVRRPDGTLAGTLANVGIHPVALGIDCRAISGDWPTVTRAGLRGSSAAPAVVIQGASGDVNPTRDPHTDPTPGGNWDTASELGREIAEVVDGLRASARPVRGEQLVPLVRQERLRAGLTLPALLAGRALRKVDVELVEWRLGDISLVAVPGEAFHALGRDIERARGDRVLLAGLAPSWLGYLPQPWGKGYEEKMSYGRGFTSAVARALLSPPPDDAGA
ncbi:MAG: hypothetical protein QOJ92_743 [Frankiales bacterium]|nr:hypothetical protein [Frankiales bacterium]